MSQAAADFSATFTEPTVAEWTKMVDEWNADHTKPDPYAEPESGTIFMDTTRRVDTQQYLFQKTPSPLLVPFS